MPAYKDMPDVSKSEINRCGEYLAELHRMIARDDMDAITAHLEVETYRRATSVVDAFRAAHQRPLSITSVGLRQFYTSQLGRRPVVSQRLKRLPRIIRKLANMERSNLARLEDIGGTRAVVRDLDEQNRLCDHIEKRWGDFIKRRRDYVADPKSTGYRARHFVIERAERRIEIQVRTRLQQRWANTIETVDSRMNLTLKDGVGPQEMLDYFAVSGDMLYYQDANTQPPTELAERHSAVTDAVVEAGYFVRRRRD
ncbi:RelA/SpoT domain-containing protein [Microbacterium sp. KNMS]